MRLLRFILKKPVFLTHPNRMTEPTYTITELSREFDVTPRTIRHYEEQGLITPLRDGQQRVYSKRDRIRLKLTLRGKRLGLSLAEIADIINLYDSSPDPGPQLVKALSLMQVRRQALEQQREDIEIMLEEIGAFEAVCREVLGRQPSARNTVKKPQRKSKTL